MQVSEGAGARSVTDKPGLLLINLGTPESPRPSDVRPYLREFLSDPRVIDIPAWRRWLFLNLFILPFRPKASGEAYEKVWTDRGSPLLYHSRDLTEKVQAAFGDGVAVDLAMRYGRPSIEEALERFYNRGVSRIVVFPLYPQYSSAATGSSIEKVYSVAARPWSGNSMAPILVGVMRRRTISACRRIAEWLYQRSLSSTGRRAPLHGLDPWPSV